MRICYGITVIGTVDQNGQVQGATWQPTFRPWSGKSHAINRKCAYCLCAEFLLNSELHSALSRDRCKPVVMASKSLGLNVFVTGGIGFIGTIEILPMCKPTAWSIA